MNNVSRTLFTILCGLASFDIPANAGDALNEDVHILPPGGKAGNWLGSSIATDSITGFTAVGAMLENQKGDLSGTAYLFDADGVMPCPHILHRYLC